MAKRDLAALFREAKKAGVERIVISGLQCFGGPRVTCTCDARFSRSGIQTSCEGPLLREGLQSALDYFKEAKAEAKEGGG